MGILPKIAVAAYVSVAILCLSSDVYITVTKTPRVADPADPCVPPDYGCQSVYVINDPLWIAEQGDLEEYFMLRQEYDDATMLSKVVYDEGRGCSPDEQRLIVWTVFNRVDDPSRFGNTIYDVVTSLHQFSYRPDAPVDPAIYTICLDEMHKWKDGLDAPVHEPYSTGSGYCFFDGGHIGPDGLPHNVFR